jgi:hypothetical protein
MAELTATERVLASHNPFRDSAVRNGFEAPGDVPEIHAEARAQLREVIAECRRDGRPRLQIVTGEPGDGKTHLLACLRAEGEASWHKASPFLLAPIDPIRELDAPFVHLLRGMTSAATRALDALPADPDGPSAPLEFLLWRILHRAIATLRESADEQVSSAAERVADLDPSHWPESLALTIRQHWGVLAQPLRDEVPRRKPFAPPQIDPEIWHVLCQFPEPQQGARVCRWLSGRSLAEEELQALRTSKSLDNEDLAYRALSTLANASDVPLVLGLDQLEGVRRLGEHAVPALFQALTTLYSGDGRWVVLVFCQAAIWVELRKALPQHVLDRLEPREIALGGVTPAQGERIVESRLAPLWRGASATPDHPTAPYPRGWVLEQIRQNRLLQPRRILAWFAEVGLTDHPARQHVTEVPPSPSEQIARELSSIRREMQWQEKNPDERAVLTQAALGSVLLKASGRSIGETQIVAARRHKVSPQGKEGIEARLQRGKREVRVYAEVHNGQNGVAAAAAVRRLELALQQQAGRALLLREDSLPLPKAAAAHLEKLGPKGGVVRVPLADALDLGAIEKLLDAAAAGELSVDEDALREAIDGEIAPKDNAVRRFLDAAFAPADLASRDAKALVETAIAAPPQVASAAAIAQQTGLTLEQVIAAGEALEREGSVQILADKEGARGIVRRPR